MPRAPWFSPVVTVLRQPTHGTIWLLTAMAIPLFVTSGAAAQSSGPNLNPIAILEDAAETIPGLEGGLSSSLNILLLLTVLSLAPAILILCTCFTRVLVVMALMRQAMGTQGLPPSQVLTGLAMFITFVVMAPTSK